MNAILSFLTCRLPHSLQCRLKKTYYPWVLRNFKEERWPPSQPVKQLLRNGDHVVDAGANIGYTTLLLSRWVGAEGHVYSIEPVPETFDLLSHNMRRLGIQNSSLFNCALSSVEGSGVMEIPLYPSGAENLYEARLLGTDPDKTRHRKVNVRLKRLDSILAPGSARIALIKLDVEGHELSAIEGAQQVIQASKPVLLIEVSGDPDRNGSAAHALFCRLTDWGFIACVQSESGLIKREKGFRATDYFFLHTDHADHKPLLQP